MRSSHLNTSPAILLGSPRRSSASVLQLSPSLSGNYINWTLLTRHRLQLPILLPFQAARFSSPPTATWSPLMSCFSPPCAPPPPSLTVCVVFVCCWRVGVLDPCRFPSNRASQQLLPEREGVYLSKSGQAVYGGSSPGPQLEGREEKSTEMRNHLGNNLEETFSLSSFSENDVFLCLSHESTMIFDWNKGPASQSSDSVTSSRRFNYCTSGRYFQFKSAKRTWAESDSTAWKHFIPSGRTPFFEQFNPKAGETNYRWICWSVSFHVGSSDRLVNRNIGENAALNEMPIKRLNPYRCAALNTLLIVSASPTWSEITQQILPLRHAQPVISTVSLGELALALPVNGGREGGSCWFEYKRKPGVVCFCSFSRADVCLSRQASSGKISIGPIFIQQCRCEIVLKKGLAWLD